MKWFGIGTAVVIVTGVIFTWFIISHRSNRELSAANVATAREHNAKEIAAHVTKSDCWVAIGGSVYDLTLYFVKHTDDVLAQQLCGQTEPNIKLPTNLKSGNLSSYRIGILSP